MEKKKSKKRRKKPPGKGGRATVPPRAISEVVSGIVRTLADKKIRRQAGRQRHSPQ
jgi:hypothetical protein